MAQIRKHSIRFSCRFVFAAGIATLLLSQPASLAAQETVFTVPPVLELSDDNGLVSGSIIAREGEHEFLPGSASASMGYNRDYLGPTLVLERGSSYEIDVENRLNDVTTLHWHGMDIAADADGGPRQPIRPGETWTARFSVDQPASTGWYHPHAMGTTAEQVALGLAGMIIVRDQTDAASRDATTALPATYGVDDLPVIIQDRRLDRSGRNAYRPTRPDIMHGFAGNTLVTNGGVEPLATVPSGWVRLRLLNGSNSAYLSLRFPRGLDAHVIATEGGYLAEPLPVGELLLAAAERYEVVVNSAALDTGEVAWIEGRTDAGLSGRVLGIQAGTERGVATLPERLPAPPPVVDAAVDTDRLPRREFVLETSGMMSRTPFTINGRAMDMSRIDERVRLGVTEIWEVTNAGPMRMTHSFHLHGTHFQVVAVNGAPPPALLTGLKDTVIVPPGATVDLAVRFERSTGVFIYHCHMLEHEEAGMMGQVQVYR